MDRDFLALEYFLNGAFKQVQIRIEKNQWDSSIDVALLLKFIVKNKHIPVKSNFLDYEQFISNIPTKQLQAGFKVCSYGHEELADIYNSFEIYVYQELEKAKDSCYENLSESVYFEKSNNNSIRSNYFKDKD